MFFKGIAAVTQTPQEHRSHSRSLVGLAAKNCSLVYLDYHDKGETEERVWREEILALFLRQLLHTKPCERCTWTTLLNIHSDRRETGYHHLSHIRKPTADTEEWSQVISLGLHQHTSHTAMSPTYTTWPRAKPRVIFESQKSIAGIDRGHKGPQNLDKGKARFVPLTTVHKWSHKLYYKQTSRSKKMATLLICWWHLLILLFIYKETDVCTGVLPGGIELEGLQRRGDSAVCTSLQQDHHRAFSIIARQIHPLLVNLLSKQSQTKCYFLSLGIVNTKGIKVMKWSDCIQYMKHHQTYSSVYERNCMMCGVL